MPVLSMIMITLALVFYTVGVWVARIAGRLRWWNVILFWLGLVADAWGTVLMMRMAGGLAFDVHGVSGLIAILLRVANAIGGTWVMLRGDEGWVRRFPRISAWVWLIWLIPWLSPMVFALG